MTNLAVSAQKTNDSCASSVEDNDSSLNMASGVSKRKFNELKSGNNTIRQRRRRTAFTEEQLDRLEECFIEEKFPGITIREELAQELNIKEDRIQVWFQNRRSRWRRRELKNKRQRTQAATPAIPPAPVFPPFPRRLDNTVTSWSFPAPFSPSTATSLALRFKTSDHQSRSVIGHSGAPYGSVMATGFPSPLSMLCSRLPRVTSLPSTCRSNNHSLEEYVAAVTLATGFSRND